MIVNFKDAEGTLVQSTSESIVDIRDRRVYMTGGFVEINESTERAMLVDWPDLQEDYTAAHPKAGFTVDLPSAVSAILDFWL